MKNLFTLFFILILASSIAQTTPLYDVEFSTAESYASGELNVHNDWESTNNNWGSELTANATNGWVMVTANWTRLHHQVPIKVTAEQNVIQLIVSFKPWNGGDTGNVIANAGSNGLFFSAGLHSLVGTASLSKGADEINNTADDDHRVEYMSVSEETSKWKIGGIEVDELAVNRVGYHLKIEFITSRDTSFVTIKQSESFPPSFNKYMDNFRDGYKILDITSDISYFETPYEAEFAPDVIRKEVGTKVTFKVLIDRSGSYLFLKLFAV